MGMTRIKPGYVIVQVAFMAPADEIAALDKLACARGQPRSKLLRELVAREIGGGINAEKR